MRKLLLIAFLACSSATAFAAGVPAVLDDSAYAMPARLVDVGGRRLNLRCSGSGSPTVVLEAALGSAGWDWGLVHSSLAKRTRTCLYDRAGLGFSDPSGRPGTTANAAEDLRLLLRNAEESPPFVLAGASYGAMIVRYFAAKNPGIVAALVLVDGQHEDEFDRINKISSGRYSKMMEGLESGFRSCTQAALRGFQAGSEEHRECLGEPPAFANRALRAAFVVQPLSAQYWESSTSEMENLHTVSSAQMRTERAMLAQVPILALVRSISPFDTPGEPQSAVSVLVEKENVRMQGEIAALSNSGRMQVISKASHAIQIDNPMAVTEAILGVVKTLGSK